MSKIQDQVRAAQGILDENGKRKFSDEEIYQKILSTPAGQKALGAAGEGDLRKYLGLGEAPAVPQDTSLARYPKMLGGALLHGAESVLGMPGTGLRLLNSLVPDDWKWSKDSPLWMIPDAEGIHEVSKNLGLTERGDVVPQNAAEKFGSAAAEGIGASIPLMGIGGVASIPQFLGAGAASGLGEETMNELFSGNPLMGLLGSVAGAMAGQSLVRGAEKAAAASGAARKLEQLQKQLDGFDLSIAQEDKVRKAVVDAVHAQADKTFTDTKNLAAAAAQSAKAGPMGEIQTQATRLAPTAMGWEDAGNSLQASARDWMTALPSKLEAAWAPIDKGIKPGRPMTLDTFEQTLGTLVKSGGAAQGLIDALTPSLPRRLQQSLAAIKGGQQMGALADFTWDGARQLRSAIGEALGDPSIVSSIGEARLKALYKSITTDLKSVADAEGLGKEFEAANAASGQLFGTAEGPIAKVLGSRLPGEIAKSLYSQGQVDASLLATLRKELPAGVDALSAAGLREGNWAKLSPQAKEVLIPDPVARQKVEESIMALGATESMHRTATEAAKSAMQGTKDAAKQGYADWRFAKREEKLKLRADLGEAKRMAEEAGVTAGSGKVASSLNRLTQIAMGGTVGGAAIDALGVNPDALMNSKFAAAAAVGLPIVVHGVNELLKHPDLAAGPLIGVSAANQLGGGMERGQQ